MKFEAPVALRLANFVLGDQGDAIFIFIRMSHVLVYCLVFFKYRFVYMHPIFPFLFSSL